MNPFDKALDLAIEPAVHRSVEFANRNPDKIKTLRHRVIKRLRTLSRQLQPAKSLLTRKLNPKAPACSLNIPLIMMLTSELGYSDGKLPRDLVYGMGISGKIEATNSLAQRETQASTNMESTKHNLNERNRNIIEALSRTKGQTLKQK